MGWSLCYKEETLPNPRDKKSTKVTIEMLTDDRMLVSFNDKPKKRGHHK